MDKLQLIMKTFFTLLSILCFQFCLAQTAGQKISYTRDLDLYVGTWEYAAATDTFRIVLRKGILSTTGLYGETLIGGYRHVQNGVLMGDYTHGIPAQFLDKDYRDDDHQITICADNGCDSPNCTFNWLDVFFKDLGLGKGTTSGSIELISPTQIHWELEEDEGVYSSDDEKIFGFSVPVDVVLVKISDSWRPPINGFQID
jgi:hypothetical protein